MRENNISLIIAGGGGGIKKISEQHPGCDASIINKTGNAGYNWPLGTGGSNGHGGKRSGQSEGKRRKKIKKQSLCSIHQDRKTTVRFIRT